MYTFVHILLACSWFGNKWCSYKCHFLLVLRITASMERLRSCSTRNTWIWLMKNISWRSAWKNEENVHLRFLIFETSLHRSLQNKLRDFQKWWIYEKYENCPFYRLFFGHIWLDMTNKNYFMTISMEKWRKYTSQFFYLENSWQRYLQNKLRDFRKSWNYEK